MGRSGELADAGRSVRAHPGTGGDDTGCTVLHADMDAFYAAVEVREAPHLANRPVVVAGAGGRGVVLSATYEARRFGIRSAMPGVRARRLCPHAVFVPPQFALYTAASRTVMGIFRSVTPLVEPLSLDEAFLDVTGSLRRLRSTPVEIAEDLRVQVRAAVGITCSVGVARTKSMAKIASGLAKPDGVQVVPLADELAILHRLPVSALWGVGGRTYELLRDRGVRTVGDLAATDVRVLQNWLGPAVGGHLHALAHGHDERAVVPGAKEKSVGSEATFAVDVQDAAVLHRELLGLAERTTAGLRRKGLRARTVALKLRWADFTTITRSRTLEVPTDGAQEVYGCARALLDGLRPLPQPVRLLGVRAEQLVPASSVVEQLRLDAPERGWRDAERAADALRMRFGSAAVRPATLLEGPRAGQGAGRDARAAGTDEGPGSGR
ncbi:MAG: DNA polymerase IV [Mycobacteriaceae bacterium]